MQDLKSLTLRWHSFPGCVRERLSTYFNHLSGQYIQNEQWRSIVNILRLTVGYLNATINRTTRNEKLEIGPDRSSQTQRNPRVNMYGARLRPPRSSGPGFWTVLEPNRTVFLVQTQTAGGLPRPVANSSIENPYYAEQRDVRATPNVAGLIRPARKSNRQVEKLLMKVNAIETRRNNGVKQK